MAIAATTLLAFSFLFGGASRSHALRLALVELAALPLLVLGIKALLQSGRLRQHAFACLIATLTVALPLLQLVPLPPDLWSALPGHAEPAMALDLAGIAPGWSPLSLTPDLTWSAFLALTPPIAIFASMLIMGRDTLGPLIWMCLAATVVSVVMATAQATTGDSRLYLWSWTDPGSAVGLFANRNHLAVLCASTVPFAGLLALSAARNRSGNRLALWLGLAYVGLMVVAIAATRSRAGIGLGVISLLASLVMAWAGLGGRRPDVRVVGLASVVAIAVGAVLVFGLAPILARFGANSLQDGRAEHWPHIVQAAQIYLPMGSGIGSFDSVYRSVEPLRLLDATYFNAAHNEYLQIWLEAGWFGVALLTAFFVWFARRSWSAWRVGDSRDRNLQRAASIAIGLILAHSFVDYPLRTETMMVFFALCCGILEFAWPPHCENRRATA